MALSDLALVKACVAAGMTLAAVKALLTQGYTPRQIARGAMVPVFTAHI